MTTREEIRAMLEKAGESYPRKQVRALCLSAASFIAAIDNSSSDVAAYLEQRFGRLLLIARQHGGLAVFEEALVDARPFAPREGPPTAGPRSNPTDACFACLGDRTAIGGGPCLSCGGAGTHTAEVERLMAERDHR